MGKYLRGSQSSRYILGFCAAVMLKEIFPLWPPSWCVRKPFSRGGMLTRVCVHPPIHLALNGVSPSTHNSWVLRILYVARPLQRNTLIWPSFLRDTQSFYSGSYTHSKVVCCNELKRTCMIIRVTDQTCIFSERIIKYYENPCVKVSLI